MRTHHRAPSGRSRRRSWITARCNWWQNTFSKGALRELVVRRESSSAGTGHNATDSEIRGGGDKVDVHDGGSLEVSSQPKSHQRLHLQLLFGAGSVIDACLCGSRGMEMVSVG